MFRASHVVIVLLVLLTGVLPTSASVIIVPNGGNIQNAVNTAAGAPGSKHTIVIHAGTYNENVVISGVDDLHLIGAEAPVLGATLGSGVGTAPPLSPNAAIIDGSGFGASCITIIDSNRITISGLEIQNCTDAGIHAFSTNGTALTDNKILQNYIHDVFSGLGVWLHTVRRNEVAGNWFEDTSNGTAILLSGEDCLINDNSIVAPLGISIGIHISPGSGNNQVAYNQVDTMDIGIFDEGFGTCTSRNRVSPSLNVSSSTNAQVVGNQIAGFPLGLVGTPTYQAENF